MPVEKGRAPEPTFLNSNSQHVQEDLNYSNQDIKHIEDWVKRELFPAFFAPLLVLLQTSRITEGASKDWIELG